MITELLAHGAERAIPARDLIVTLGVDMRTFYATVERERRAGSPICANKTPSEGPVGYYLAANRAEALNYARAVDFTAQGMKRTAKAIRTAAAKLPE